MPKQPCMHAQNLSTFNLPRYDDMGSQQALSDVSLTCRNKMLPRTQDSHTSLVLGPSCTDTVDAVAAWGDIISAGLRSICFRRLVSRKTQREDAYCHCSKLARVPVMRTPQGFYCPEKLLELHSSDLEFQPIPQSIFVARSLSVSSMMYDVIADVVNMAETLNICGQPISVQKTVR